MTRAVGDDDSLLKSLQEVVGLFREAQISVFKLMSSVSKESNSILNRSLVDLYAGLGTQIS